MLNFKLIACALLLAGPCPAWAQDASVLKLYTECNLGDEFQIVKVDRLPQATSRTVQIKDGTRDIVLLDGYRVLITYDLTEGFVNLEAERLQKGTYPRDKQTLLDSLETTAGRTPDMVSMKPSKLTMNGFDLYGIDRKKLSGGVLGIYNLFHDSDQIVVTMYLLNAEPAERKFQTIEQYYVVRDKFLRAYTSCLAESKR